MVKLVEQFEKYIDYHVLFMTMVIVIAYRYVTKDDDTIILKYK